MTGAETTTQKQAVLIRKKSSGVAFVIIDGPGKVNLLSSDFMDEFEAVSGKLAGDPAVRAAVFISGKPDSFILGADLHEIIKMTEPSQPLALSRRGQNIMTAVANLPIPTIAAINGPCLGGGLEVALVCDRRIATDAANTLLGLPETKLGFVPGIGGTQRLPRLIGAKAGVEMILTADPVDAHRAKELGLVDEVVKADDLMERAHAMALEMIEAGKPKPVNKAAEELTPEKMKSFFAMVERSVRVRTKGKYPAQTRAVAVMQKGLAEGLEAGLLAEAEAFGELSVTDVSRNLVFLYFTTEFVKQSALHSYEKSAGKKIKTVGVVGGGLMGTTIAQQSALNGFKVLVKALNDDRQQLAFDKVSEYVERIDSKNPKGKVVSLSDFAGLHSADIVLEACTEDEKVKADVLKKISQSVSEGCIIATNTSSLSIGALAEQVSDQSMFLGMHFFQPVDKMPLVEVVSHGATARDTTARAAGFICQLSKTPVVMKDSPSFLVNRFVSSYLGQAARMALLDVPLSWVEDAALDFGMPMPPYVLSDEIGLDVAFECAKSLEKAFGPTMAPPKFLDQMVDAGLVGRKTGRGIYLYNEKGTKSGFNPILFNKLGCISREEKPSQAVREELAEQMILPMIDEACRCLEQKVVRRPREIDLCVVLGMGFPPFRGGLLRYADTIGAGGLITKLERIYEKSKWDVSISDYLRKLASEGRGFYTRGAGDE